MSILASRKHARQFRYALGAKENQDSDQDKHNLAASEVTKKKKRRLLHCFQPAATVPHVWATAPVCARGAEQLPFLVSAAVRGYVPQLGGLVPDVLNNQGRHFLPFTKFEFEIINSDLLDQSRHQVAINFYSEPLVWHETIAPYLLVSEKAAGSVPPGETLTHLLQLQPFVSIHALHAEA